MKNKNQNVATKLKNVIGEYMISNYFKEHFKERKISQNEIEKKTGISQSKISLALSDKRKLSAEELLKIAIAFDIDLNKIKEIIQSPNKNDF